MYRLVLYVLLVLTGIALVISSVGSLPFTPVSLVVSLIILTVLSWFTNTIFAAVFGAQTNLESVYISALILVLIITPIGKAQDLPFLIWAPVLTMGSKYMLAIGKKHIFNPVAIAVTITSFAINQSASWWVGTGVMLPFVLVGGMLIVRKVQKYDMIMAFMVTSIVMFLAGGLTNGTNPVLIFETVLVRSPWIFFLTVMLTEPLTSPTGKNQQIIYGVLAGFLFSPQIHIGSVYTTPESALILANIYAYFISPKYRLILSVKEKLIHSRDLYDFIFDKEPDFTYNAGQYLEWTLAHPGTDERGNRRYFTLASSPTEPDLRIGVKFSSSSSTFKRKLLSMANGEKIIASQLSGDFILPKDRKIKLVFIAGGIGITPFRSIFKFITDKRENRDIILFYSNRREPDIIYRDVFDDAKKSMGIKTVYVLTDKDNLPAGWTGQSGRINSEMIMAEVPDFKERYFYLSGPRSMVTSFEDVLRSMGIKNRQIKTDFFPGFV